MAQHYSDPEREADPHALPDLEIFYMGAGDLALVAAGASEERAITLPGWYWWACFPGCLPDSDPVGPFDTEAEALADARGNLS